MARISRLQKTESKRAFRTTIWYGLLTILILFLMLRFGTVYLFRFTNYILTLAGEENSTSATNSVAPLVPTVEDLPEYTKQEKIRVKGRSQDGMTVVILVNSNKKEVVADAQGEFNAEVSLSKNAPNEIHAYAVNNAGEQSAPSRKYIVTFDDKPPTLEIISPSSGSSYYLETQRNQRIEGQTEENVSVTINDRIVIINNENKFNFSVRLENGENKFTIRAVDEAGNETKIEDYVLNLSL